MNFSSPKFFLFGLLLCVGLATANYRGWSLLATIAARTWDRSQPGLHHK